MKRCARVVVAGIVVVLAGCAPAESPAPGVADRWRTEIDALLTSDLSELERQVLADYEITDAELAEAQDAYARCMSDRGLEADFGDGDGDVFAYGATPESQDTFRNASDDPDAAFEQIPVIADECADGTIWDIGLYYHEMRSNPEGKTLLELWRECLDPADVDEVRDLTDQELQELIDDESFVPSAEVSACLS
ncbi:hypothetical protein JOE63_002907 [Cellulosimicrobium cellulans]|uniref:hypothetical protein n=1 Tax=Cellulosimicrobium cellulans TaxID=1710 RepID=UPI0012FD0AEF|nr:hypothetical protein [Cellulosimicrobium cellulans]MBM7820430.1 hypothetical protein [Cellulosimicrobium cellulans]